MALMRILAVACLLAAIGGGVSAAMAEQKPAAERKQTAGERMFLILYRPGENWDASKRVWQQALGGHKDYLIDRYADGVLKFAGPFTDDWGGGVVVRADDADAAAGIARNDPAVQNGVFVFEIHPWFLVDWDEALAQRENNIARRVKKGEVE